MPRPIKTFEEKLWPRVDKSNGENSCWNWLGSKTKAGYAHMSHGKNKTVGVHRVAFFLHNGYWPDVVMHSCDNPSCCNPSHLKGGTQKENIADMFKKGRQSKTLSHLNRKRGSKNPASKLNEDDVKRILSSSLSQRKLAVLFGVSRRCIAFIQQGKTWKHVKRS